MRHCDDVRFGPFELDASSRELRTEAGRIRLQDQPFEILQAMLERPGEVVTRETLRRRLWPDGTFVDFEHSLNAAIKRLRAALGDAAESPRYVETLPRRGYRFIATVGSGSGDRGSGTGDSGSGGQARSDHVIPDPRSPILRLAVLPFNNLSGDPAEDYFSDGLTDEMIAQAGRLCRGRVAVLARTSCMAVKATMLRANEIAETLRANYLLEGSVRREGDRVRITARLIEGEQETQLWAQTYDRALGDYCEAGPGGRLSVQSDVALRIARSLATELAPDSHAGLLRATPPGAFQAFLKGRYFWNMAGDGGLDQAITWFEEALHLAPSFPDALAALARAHVLRAEYYRERPRAALETAQALAARALAIDPELPEAHVAQADVHWMLAWDWHAAEQAYLRAQALNPSHVAAYRGYARMLGESGRHDEATRAFERAFELDPMCLDAGVCAAWVSYLADDSAAAIDYCRNTLDMDRHYGAAWRVLGAASLEAGQRDEALAALHAAVGLSPAPVPRLWLAHGLAVSGATAEALRVLAEVQSQRVHYVSPYAVAMVHAALGRCDEAFAALAQALADADPALCNLAVDPRFRRLRDDPRFDQTLRRLNLR